MGLPPSLEGRLGSPNFAFRTLDLGEVVRFVIVDERELQMAVVSDASSRLTADADVFVWTDATDFVRTQLLLFDRLWPEAQEIAGLVPERSVGVRPT